MDHVGFEIKALEVFWERPAQTSVKIDATPRHVPDAALTLALLTDPWGTSIERTEGLRAMP